MSFFQNPFDQEFRGNLVLGDRQYILTFQVKPNRNKSDYQLAYNSGPYDFSAGGNLTINYAWDQDFKNWSSLVINVTGAVPAATTTAEVVTLLNANVTFAELFTAQIQTPNSSLPGTTRILIVPKSTRQVKNIRVYISNTGAEQKLRFNRYAGVAELPTYMERHTIDNRFNFPDSLGMLVLLNPALPQDQAIITDAGLDFSVVLADWQLFAGRSQIFNFRKQTVDGSSRITRIIEYPAGAKAGDLARRTDMSYTGAKTEPDQITEIPYTLATADLVLPPP